jgi:hypothetical protein
VLTDLGGTIGAASYTNWKWTGVLTGAQLIGLVASLAVAVAGMIAAAKRNTTLGLLPAAACLSYLLGNALARTSGGRYIVPVDWIVLLYFALGLAVITRGSLVALGLGGGASTSTSGPAAAQQDQGGTRRALRASAVGVLLAGGLLLVPAYAFRPAEQESEIELASELIEFLTSHEAGVDADYVRQLMLDRGQAYSGKILYPRSAAGAANGEFFFSTTTTRIPFPILAFSLLGPSGDYEVRLAMPDSDKVRHAEEAIVIGCERSRSLEAVVVMLRRPEPEIRFRDPLPPPTCPFMEPVCDQNGNCR